LADRKFAHGFKGNQLGWLELQVNIFQALNIGNIANHKAAITKTCHCCSLLDKVKNDGKMTGTKRDGKQCEK